MIRHTVTDGRSENKQAEDVLDSLRPSPELSRKIGAGGNVREYSSVADAPSRSDLTLAQDQVRDQLQKSRKLLVSPHFAL